MNKQDFRVLDYGERMSLLSKHFVARVLTVFNFCGFWTTEAHNASILAGEFIRQLG